MSIRTKKSVSLPLLAAVLICICMALPELCCGAVPAFSQEGRDEQPSTSPVPVVELKGDWMIMGMQYGKQAGPEICGNVDAVYRLWSAKSLGDDYLRETLRKYSFHMKALSPDIFSFIEGISMGAEKALRRSVTDGKLDDREKILLLNCAIELLGNDEWHSSRAWNRNPVRTGGPLRSRGRGACWAALKEETFSRDLICGFIRDLPYLPKLQQVALRMVPDSEGAQRSAAIVPAGWIGGDCAMSGSKLFAGVIPVNGACRARASEIDYGLPIVYITCYMVSYCTDPSEAAMLLTEGSEEYRKATGRATLLPAQAANYLLADSERAVVVERTAHHYYVRGKDDRSPARVISNYFVGSDSFNGEALRTLTPMTQFGTAFSEDRSNPAAAEVNLIAGRIAKRYCSMTAGEARSDMVEIFRLSQGGGRSGLSGAFLTVMPTLSMDYSVTPLSAGTWGLLRLFN
jgi:hypothetical protein